MDEQKELASLEAELKELREELAQKLEYNDQLTQQIRDKQEAEIKELDAA